MADRSNVVKLTSNYRKLGEPMLYKAICLHSEQYDRIKQLLLTLLERSDLCLMVKSFTLFHGMDELFPPPRLDDTIRYMASLESKQICDRFWTQIQELSECICTEFHFLPELRGIWFHKLFEPCPLFDGALSLLLSLALNLTELHLEACPQNPLPITTFLASNFEWNHPLVSNQDTAFAKLQSCSVKSVALPNSEVFVSITPGLEELSITGSLECQIFVPASVPLDANTLRILKLLEVDLHPAQLEHAIKFNWLRSVEVLELDSVGYGNINLHHECPWLKYGYRGLKEAMQFHMPGLKTFSWGDMRYDFPWHDALVPFSSFANFPCLEQVSIDYKPLVHSIIAQHPQDDIPDLRDYPSYFSKALRDLELKGVGWYLMEKAYADYLDASDARPDVLLTLIPFFLALPCKKIRICASLMRWPHQAQHRFTRAYALDEPAVHLLRSLVDMFQKVGTYLYFDLHHATLLPVCATTCRSKLHREGGLLRGICSRARATRKGDT